MHRIAFSLVFVLAAALASSASAQSGRGAASPDPCALFTKSELQQLTGHADVMRTPNMPDQLPSGGKVCTVDGGGGRGAQSLDIEIILSARTPGARGTVPRGAEAVSGIGELAYYQQSAGNGAAYGHKGAWALRIGVQSGDTPQNLRTVAVALLKAGIAKLPT